MSSRKSNPTALITCRIKPHIQPFERELAVKELNALTVGSVTALDGDTNSASNFQVDPTNDARRLRRRLAYWHSVGKEKMQLTMQIRAEATQRIAQLNSQLETSLSNVPAIVPSHLPNRRYLRYGTHGIHEYRGKFFPQLVPALMNIADLPSDAVVVDPMCGSGTTLVESRLSGRVSHGFDMNPLSVFISKAKCAALAIDHGDLIASSRNLIRIVEGQHSDRASSYVFDSLGDGDQQYLKRWFPQHVIEELDRIAFAIDQLQTNSAIKGLYKVAFSNILRKVSLQKNEDLRVRREEKRLLDGQATSLFVKEADRTTSLVVAFLAERGKSDLGAYSVCEGDARDLIGIEPGLEGKVDAVITSPPYATALPYLETDRLSLIYLGLLPRDRHRKREEFMIGTREVSPSTRAAFWAQFEEQKSLLPLDTRELIESIDSLNKEFPAGFRRMNLSALLSKYFFDMREVIRQLFRLLRPNGSMFLVVGSNHTRAGQIHIDIETPRHLSLIACDIGFEVIGAIPMEMLPSRTIYKKNAINSECLIELKKR